jgi:DNA primase
MSNKVIQIELSDEQQSKFDEWAKKIKDLFGEYGLMTWSVTSYGMGSSIKVYNHLTKLELDLTDEDSW